MKNPQDGAVKAAVGRSISLGVPIYLSASWAYYHLDQTFIGDETFDWLGRQLLLNWHLVQHRHKHLITEGELLAGTLLLSPEGYPEMAKGAAEYLLGIASGGQAN